MKNYATFTIDGLYNIKITQFNTDREGYENGNRDVVDYITETRINTLKWDENKLDFIDEEANNEDIIKDLEKLYPNLDLERE